LENNISISFGIHSLVIALEKATHMINNKIDVSQLGLGENPN
jgi:hypothetical protein